MYYYSVHSVNALSSHFGFWDRGVGEIPTTFRVRNLMSGSIPIGISDWGPGNPDTITWLKNHTEQENTAAFHSNERKHYIICGLVFWLRIVIIKKRHYFVFTRESFECCVHRWASASRMVCLNNTSSLFPLPWSCTLPALWNSVHSWCTSLAVFPSCLILLKYATCIMVRESGPDTSKSRKGREDGWSEKKNPITYGVFATRLPSCLQTPDGLKAVSNNMRVKLLTSFLALCWAALHHFIFGG